MKRVILTVAAVLLILAAIAGALIFINALTSAPSGKVINENDAYVSDDVNKIDVNVEVAYINVYRSTGTLVEVGFFESREGLYASSLSDGTLTVTESKSSWLDRLGRSDSARYGIEIGIPDGKTVELKISAEASAVTLNGITLTGNTEIEVAAGSVSVNGVETDGYISADVTAGGVKFEYTSCSEISAEVGTGDIFIRSVDAEKAISLATGAGKVTGFISGSREDYRVASSIVTGVSELESGGDGPVELIVTVNTGSIALEFTR